MGAISCHQTLLCMQFAVVRAVIPAWDLCSLPLECHWISLKISHYPYFPVTLHKQAKSNYRKWQVIGYHADSRWIFFTPALFPLTILLAGSEVVVLIFLALVEAIHHLIEYIVHGVLGWQGLHRLCGTGSLSQRGLSECQYESGGSSNACFHDELAEVIEDSKEQLVGDGKRKVKKEKKKKRSKEQKRRWGGSYTPPTSNNKPEKGVSFPYVALCYVPPIPVPFRFQLIQLIAIKEIHVTRTANRHL